MRTKEQLDNLRMVLSLQIGSAAAMLPDKLVDAYADNLQEHLDNLKYHWRIKVRKQDNVDVPWEDILYEPRYPFCSYKNISIMCHKLLEKYSSIIAIQIQVFNNLDATYLFERRK